MAAMVYADQKPTYDEVLANLSQKTQLVLPKLEELQFA